MKPKVFVDGQEGTTGLRIHEHLAQRRDLEVLKIAPEKRKDGAARKELLNAADVAFLCLPEAASREAVALVENPKTCIIDASTAFRIDPAWAYGLPELSAAQRKRIQASKRVANPGCHASAFILAVYPLLRAGIIASNCPLSCISLTGYSGGGKKMIAAYEDPAASAKLRAPRPYALTLRHKHLPEMQHVAGLTHPPVFTPIVCDIHSGLAVEVFLPAPLLAKPATPEQIAQTLAAYYAGEPFIRVLPFDPQAKLDDGFFDITACNQTNRADIVTFGHEGQVVVMTRLDNLGKGASGAALQCMNLVLGFDETLGLTA